MLATGRTLEAAAERRASRDLRALLDGHRAPPGARVGDRCRSSPLAEVAPGDLLVVAPGEVVPVDGVVEGGIAVLDESALTGEALAGRAWPTAARAQRRRQRRVGVRAAGHGDRGGQHLRRDRAPGSRGRRAERPVVRLADRYAAWFLPLSLAAAGLAWLVSGSAVRAVAVLVVATPCPLLLAAPVAIVSGLSRASRRGVIVRGGGALENLGRARTLVLDKTGTLTVGRPAVVEVVAAPGEDPAEVLRLARLGRPGLPARAGRRSSAEARARHLPLALPHDVARSPAAASRATVEGRRVEVGKRPTGRRPDAAVGPDRA